MYALEEHRFSADGHLETIGARKYHTPTVSSVPLEMNVTLLKDSGNPKTVYSSKVLQHCSVYTPCPEKKEATSFLGITLTNLNTVS